MSNILTLTTVHLGKLRTVGDTTVQAGDRLIRVIRDGSGYSPLLSGDGSPCPDQVVLSTADLDVIEQQPEGLACGDATGSAGWTVRAEVPA